MIKVAFICVHNSCRSQMAEGYAKELGKGVLEVYSAGTEEYTGPKPMAIEVMKDDSIDISKHTSKLLEDIPQDIDIVITMGCNVNCPSFPSRFREDWALIDPSGLDKYRFELTRNIIRFKIEELVDRVKNNQIKLN